ncbi:MAG: (deoxy)nucleoside triphosphate pyrophosphohydrolase [Bdellovibrionota bacterium]
MADVKKTRKGYWIPVVAGFLKKEDMILVGKRPENHSLAGLWEFPGGKIESGESPEEALARELDEELGIQAEIGDLKLCFTHSYGDVGILILFFEVKYWKGEPKAKIHVELDWINPLDLAKRNIPEANRKLLPRIMQALEVEWPKS